MQKSPFIWLGAHRAHKRGVGEKGIWLDKAAKGRLPVPNGGILLELFYQMALDADLLRVGNKRVLTPSTTEFLTAFYEDIRFPRLQKSVAVRPAFSTAEGEAIVRPEAVQLNIDPNDADSFIGALCEVYSSALSYEGEMRRDVLVMEMVQAEVAGSALTLQAEEADEIWVGPERLAVPKLTGWFGKTAVLPPHIQRAQMLLRGLRRTLGQGDWQIDWLDDGEVCWLIQVNQVASEQGE